MSRPQPSPAAGTRFGRLEVIREVEPTVLTLPTRRMKVRKVECRCECGSLGTFDFPKLRRGHTQSCGCLAIESRRKATTRHGFAPRGRPATEYRIWADMLQRCNNPRRERYRDYGGRGIAVCERWLKFENFLADMGLRPSPELSLDRENNDLGYFAENCRWATRTQQARNRRRSRARSSP